MVWLLGSMTVAACPAFRGLESARIQCSTAAADAAASEARHRLVLFYLRTVAGLQAFHNLNPYADIFNHANIHFWEYMQPGYDALNFISCTGTNFLMRAQAFSEVSSIPHGIYGLAAAALTGLRCNGWLPCRCPARSTSTARLSGNAHASGLVS